MTCTACSVDKPESEFNWRNKKKGIRLRQCKSCLRQYNKTWYEANRVHKIAQNAIHRKKRTQERRSLLNQIKAKTGCMDCGEADPVVLDFDHLEDKLDDVSTIVNNGTWEAVLAEIKKCEVVCANCHRRRTISRR